MIVIYITKKLRNITFIQAIIDTGIKIKNMNMTYE